MYRPTTTNPAYRGMTAFAGDIHNHCGISYGHGSIEDAYRNARLQLDFASVTGHAAWHDMPAEPAHVSAYHTQGFERLRQSWDHVQDVTEAVHEDGTFVSLLSFEWHSMTYGDHCVYFPASHGPLDIAQAPSLEALRAELRTLARRGLPGMVLPHHIGYHVGRRGINWSTFDEELSPVVELVSMHGSGESAEAPRPYLHTMGPRDAGSTAFHGLSLGRRFGVIGSTDHHSAHPGSHGWGRAMVWADELTRESIWSAVQARRTYAVTGDSIMLATAIGDVPMGAETTARPGEPLDVQVDARAGDAIDYVELVRNGVSVARTSPHQVTRDARDFGGVLSVSFGWGEVGVPIEWDVRLRLTEGRLRAVEPRLRGYDTLADQAGETDRYSFSAWKQVAEREVTLLTRTRGNPTVTTDATQEMALHVDAPLGAELVVETAGQTYRHTLAELLDGPRTHYVGGFLSGALVMNRAQPDTALTVAWQLEDEGSDAAQDWYLVRVRQHNDQHAWSSPTWVRRTSPRGHRS